MSPNINNIVLAAVTALALAGCATRSIHSAGPGNYPERNEVPIAANFPTSNQLKLQAAEHWRRVAQESAEALVKGLPRGGLLHLRRSCNASGCAPRACETTFTRVFHNDFLTALVGLGYQVTEAPAANALIVDVDAQAVAFAPNRPQYRYAGRAVQLGPGLWALGDTSSLIDPQGAEARRTAGWDTNWFRTEFAAGPTPRNELVVTVSAMTPAQAYVARSTRVYYTADADAGHYFCGGQDPARARTWTIPVVGECSPGRCVEAAPGRRQ